MTDGGPFGRADYAPPFLPEGRGGVIASVTPRSPAWEAGLEAGMIVASVNGMVPHDVIDWRWEADGSLCELEVLVPGEHDVFSAILERAPGDDWGIEFSDVLFDGIRTCVNACEFCFLKMLPEGERASLYVRDDDYRLSFLQGNFVTLTNVDDADVERIVRYRLSPMNVSLHAVTPEVRRRLIGAHAPRGMEVLTRLLEQGIEVHGQVVVCPGINDAEELRHTLDWVEPWPTFTSLALVPMGYTKYSRRFNRSFSEDVEASRAVVELLGPYQERARAMRGITRFQLSDEFYLDAHMEVPAADTYDGYPQFYDGIGMLRSFIDEAREVCRMRRRELDTLAGSLVASGRRILLVCGEAALAVVADFAAGWNPDGIVQAQAIRNDYYGGDVNVTGLITAVDLLAQLPNSLMGNIVVLPEAMFNSAGDTLDGSTCRAVSEELRARGAMAVVATTAPSSIVDAVAACLR